MFRFIRFLVSHTIALAIGFALGVYLLPILTAPDSPSDAEVASSSQQAMFSAEFRRDLTGSDFLHWGEGRISISDKQLSFSGSMAPGPDYQLYLTPELVQTEQELLSAIEYAKKPEGEGKTIVAIIPSFGERYLNTDLFAPYRYEGSDDV